MYNINNLGYIILKNVNWLSPEIGNCGWFWFLLTPFCLCWIFFNKHTGLWNIIKGNNFNCGEKKWVSWDRDEINYVAIHESEWLFGPKNQNSKIFCKRYHFFLRQHGLLSCLKEIGCSRDNCETGASDHLPGWCSGRAHTKLLWEGTQRRWGFKFVLCWCLVKPFV